MGNVVIKKTKQPNIWVERVKWSIVWAIVSVSIWGNMHYNGVLLLYRVLAILGLAIVAILIAKTTQKGGYFWNILVEAKSEIRRVVWPTRQETTQTTFIVIIVVFFMGMVLWGIDTMLGWFVKTFLN